MSKDDAGDVNAYIGGDFTISTPAGDTKAVGLDLGSWDATICYGGASVLGMPGDNPSEGGRTRLLLLESVGGLEFSRQLIRPASWDCKVYRSVGKTPTLWASGTFNSDHEFKLHHPFYYAQYAPLVGTSHLT